MTTFSALDELRRLRPLPLDDAPGEDPTLPDEAPSRRAEWEELTRILARTGKQQMRANQNAEATLDALQRSLGELSSGRQAAMDEAAELRRERARLIEDARAARLEVLAVVDSLDDLLVVSQQKQDAAWVGRVERLLERTLTTFAVLGLTEIPAQGALFDEQVHEAVGTVQRLDRPQYVVVEVLRRGFRYNGTVLRKAQVVATR